MDSPGCPELSGQPDRQTDTQIHRYTLSGCSSTEVENFQFFWPHTLLFPITRVGKLTYAAQWAQIGHTRKFGVGGWSALSNNLRNGPQIPQNLVGMWTFRFSDVAENGHRPDCARHVWSRTSTRPALQTGAFHPSGISEISIWANSALFCQMFPRHGQNKRAKVKHGFKGA